MDKEFYDPEYVDDEEECCIKEEKINNRESIFPKNAGLKKVAIVVEENGMTEVVSSVTSKQMVGIKKTDQADFIKLFDIVDYMDGKISSITKDVKTIGIKFAKVKKKKLAFIICDINESTGKFEFRFRKMKDPKCLYTVFMPKNRVINLCNQIKEEEQNKAIKKKSKLIVNDNSKECNTNTELDNNTNLCITDLNMNNFELKDDKTSCSFNYPFMDGKTYLKVGFSKLDNRRSRTLNLRCFIENSNELELNIALDNSHGVDFLTTWLSMLNRRIDEMLKHDSIDRESKHLVYDNLSIIFRYDGSIEALLYKYDNSTIQIDPNELEKDNDFKTFKRYMTFACSIKHMIDMFSA